MDTRASLPAYQPSLPKVDKPQFLRIRRLYLSSFLPALRIYGKTIIPNPTFNA